MHEDDIVISNASGDIGYGIFAKAGRQVQAGDVVTEYPGDVEWRTEEQLTYDARHSESGTYVFSVGPFQLHNPERSMYLVWGRRLYRPAQARFVSLSACAHMANTYHPLLHTPWCIENCVFGLYLNELRLTQRRPQARMYLVCIRSVTGPSRPVYGPMHELRVDYHWCLALLFDFWCVRRDCERCLENLSEFLRSLGY